MSAVDGHPTSLQEVESAIDHFERQLRQGVDDPLTLTNFGTLLWRMYQFDRAIELFDRVVADVQSDTSLFRHIAKCYFEIGRFDRSAETMQAAIGRLSGPDPDILTTAAWALERDNQLEAARELTDRILHIAPHYAPAVRLAAHLDKRADDFPRAIDRITRQLQTQSTDFDWGLRYELAGVLDRSENHQAAWQALELAKIQLKESALPHLALSHHIRARQWDLAQRITHADLARWHGMTAHLTHQRICFLIGFPRAGTTLLEQIIASHTDAIDTDESGIMASQFIAPLVWYAQDPGNALLELRIWEAEQLTVGRNTFQTFTEGYLNTAWADHLLIEKNPLLTADLPVALRLFPEARILVALRDPRDVILSYLFTMVPLNWSSAPAISVVEACQFYADTMRHWLFFRDRIHQPWHELHYEQLIADSEAQVRQATHFLELEWMPSMLDAQHRSSRRAVRTPTYDDVTKPLYRRAIGRWQHYQEFLRPGLHLLQPFIDAWGYN